MKHLFLNLLILTLSPLLFAQSNTWEVKNSWSAAKEDLFADFIAHMGKSTCNTLSKCLKNAASNPAYVQKTPKEVKYYADCADLPFSLRAYFSWMEGLPFDYVNDVSPIGGGSDVRYSKDGNSPNGFKKIASGKLYDGPQELKNISESISTAMYRMHYKYISDFYPAGINSKDIRPGTVLYDPSGHAAIIYDIDKKDGAIKMMDAHPDGSITRIRFDQKFVRSRVSHGAGFKNWRPELSDTPTELLAGFSKERFQDKFVFNSTPLDYYDYVKTVMSGGNLKVNPIEEIKAMVGELCANTADRVIAVDSGIRSGIQKEPHPPTLPKNIYGTVGEWEEYSTPSRDARLKTGFVTLVTETERFVQMYNNGSDRIDYLPKNNVKALASDLLKAYRNAISAPDCNFKYVKSDGTEMQLGYDDVVSRLFKISFDPYHCIELRWGATDAELDSCKDGQNKLTWYAAEQGLRNQIERKYDDVMDFDLSGTLKNLGVSQAPDADLEGYLESLL